MSTPNISREAEALDALLDRRPYSSFDLDPRDAELADQIQEIAGEGITSDARFYRQLEQTLLETAEKRSRRRWLVLPTLLISLSGSAVLIVLVMLSGLLVWKLLGQPSAPGASESATPVMALPADQATPIAAVQPSPEPVMATETVVEPLEERAGSFLLKVPLPDGPTDVPRYRQVQGGEPLTAESAQSMAAQLGVEGPVFGAMGEIGVATYQVQDGKRAVLFFGATTSEFSYSASYSAAGWAGKSPLPFEEQAAVTTQWLEERSLFDPAYQVEPLPTDPSVVMIVQKLESGNLYEENLYGPRFYISISPTGQVLSVISQPVFLETDGRLSIRPAAEVWESLKTGELPSQTFFQTLDFSRRRSLRTWYRTYPVGETVDVYGVANALQPVDPNQATNVQVNGLSLLGDSALVAQIPMGPLLRVWGVYQVDEAGYHWLDLQGWEVSPVEEVHLTGTLVRENSVLQFKTEAGEWINLPDLPPDAPEGEMLSVSGAQTGPNEVQWRYLQTVIGQDDNVQIGSLPVPGMPTEPVMPALPLPETGFQPGDKVELRGYVQASILQYSDGSEEPLNRFTTSEFGENNWMARLVGEGAQGIEQYHNLPVMLTGIYGVENHEITITVDRYEPAWPGVSIEPWFGTVDEKNLAGRNVLILTQDDGTQWVMGSSLRFEESLAGSGWEPGTEIVIEGYPNQEGDTQFGGLPVLQNLSIGLLNHKNITRETYTMYTNLPQVEVVEGQPDASLPAGTVEKIELVYHAQQVQGALPADETARLLLPLWRFSGHLEDGRAFELLAPAARDAAMP